MVVQTAIRKLTKQHKQKGRHVGSSKNQDGGQQRACALTYELYFLADNQSDAPIIFLFLYEKIFCLSLTNVK